MSGPPLAPADITIREVGAGDAAALDALLSGLDARSRYLRWFTGAPNVRHASEQAAHPERQHAVGLVAVAGEQIVGHAMLVPDTDGRAEVAFEVVAAWRHHGIAGALLTALGDAARARGIATLFAEVLAENTDMLAVFGEHGARLSTPTSGVVTVELDAARA